MTFEVLFVPDRKHVRVRPGTTLFQCARMAKVTIRSRCGGNAACLMCKVKVLDQSGLAPMDPKERLKLGSLGDEGYRLSCQARVIGNVTVVVPEDPLKAAIRAQLAMLHDEDGD